MARIFILFMLWAAQGGTAYRQPGDLPTRRRNKRPLYVSQPRMINELRAGGDGSVAPPSPLLSTTPPYVGQDIDTKSKHHIVPTFPRNLVTRHTSWHRYILPSKEMLPELVGEAFGTFLLLQLALGIIPSALITQSMTGVFPLAVLTGGAITVAVTAVNSICDAHFNPAITLAMCLYRRFGWIKFVPYVASQLFGAILATLVNYSLYARHIQQFELRNGITRAALQGVTSAKFAACYFDTALVSPVAAFVAEAIGTFMLTATVFSLSSDRNAKAKKLNQAPIVGSVVALVISYLGPLTCASINPARELGPRLVLKFFGWTEAAFHQIGIYLLAPFVGAIVAGWFVENWLYGQDRQYVHPQSESYRREHKPRKLWLTRAKQVKPEHAPWS